MNNNDEVKRIDLKLIYKRIEVHKKVFLITLPMVLILSYLLILAKPRTYSSSTVMAPEMGSSVNLNSIGDLASSFGIDLPSGQTVDAISPLLYPNLMSDNGFVSKLFKVKVKTIDGKVNVTYYDYLLKHNKAPWWTMALEWMKAKLSSTHKLAEGYTKFDPYHLSKIDNDLAGAIRGSIKITTDKKTGVISITTEAQDPMVCKTLADSTRSLLQQYITDYRTSKARNDVKHYQDLVNDAKRQYEGVRQAYGAYSDANMDVILESFKSKQEDLENDMQLKFNAYSALLTQLNVAKAKLQDRTPAFTTIQGAEVPIKPSGPKRMVFAFAMTIIAAVLLTLWYSREVIFSE